MSELNPIRVFSVDDHPLLREGIAAMINNQPDMLLVAQAATGGEAVQKFREHSPDVTLMDLRLPDMSGIDALIAIRTEFAEARVITAKAEAKKADAGGVRELGLAEAEVIKAKGHSHADITQQQAEAEAEGTKDKELAIATGIEAKALAEAKGIEEKAKAMKLLHEAGRQHEEFRLQLAKERDVELAAIRVEKDVAEAHSRIVAEALKNAKIDIVGGENDFFEKVVRAVGTGKAVDRLVSSSSTLSDVKQAFFNGDPEHFKEQLRQWVKDFGVSSEDLKNLTVAALLAKLLVSTKDASVQSLLRSAQDMARAIGVSDVPAAKAIASTAPVNV